MSTENGQKPALPDGWRTQRHTTLDFDYFVVDFYADGYGTRLYADAKHQDVEVGPLRLTPDEARVLAFRLAEAADLAQGGTQ